jgi:hypothetical protein
VRRTLALPVLAALAVSLSTWPAGATPGSEDAPSAEPPVTIAVIAGVATAFVPMLIGGLGVASAPTTLDAPRNVGFAVAGVGPALSPIVAHAVLGEWARAAAFGAPAVASEVGICALMAAEPDAVFHGTIGSRTAFAMIFTADITAAAVGIVDVMMARERWLARHDRHASDPLHGLRITPRVGRGQAALVLGGSL